MLELPPKPKRNIRAAKKAAIVSIIEQARYRMGLGDIALDIQWYDRRSQHPFGEDCQAGCTASPEYKEARLVFTLDELDWEKIPATVVHELCHIPLWGMTAAMDRWAGNDEEKKETARTTLESATTHFERVLMDLL